MPRSTASRAPQTPLVDRERRPRPTAAPCVRILHAEVPGRVRCRVDGLHRDRRLRRVLEQSLGAIPTIVSASASDLTGNLLVLTRPAVDRRTVVRLVAHIVQDYRRGRITLRARAHVTASGRRHDAVRVVKRILGIASPPEALWHAIDTAEAARRLATTTSGLTSDEAESRLRSYGRNTLTRPTAPSDLAVFLRQLHSLPVALLGAAALISMLTGGLADAFVIMTVVGVNAAVGYVTERQSSRAIQSVMTLSRPLARVIRDDREQTVGAEGLVPGDLLVLRQGTLVEADARLIHADRLTVDESTLTGESLPVSKEVVPVVGDAPLADRTSIVYRGTLVTGGQGQALVMATGTHTEIGKLQQVLEALDAGASPLQRELDELGRRLTVAATAICMLVFLLGLARGVPLLKMFKIAISLAVSAIPEGLPAVATTTLALGIGRLRARGVIIRHLTALETFGALQTLCLDKTGTITENRMTVVSAYANRRRLDRLERALTRLRHPAGQVPPPFGSLLRLAALCTETRLATDDPPRFEGSPTELALLEAAAAAGIDVVAERRRNARVRTLLRSEGQNFMCTVHSRGPSGRRRRALAIVKGNPSEVLDQCATHLIDGRCRRLGDIDRFRILQANDDMSRAELRVLGVAYARVPADGDRVPPDHLTWVGLVAMADRVRDGAAALLRTIHRAGIRPVMITGDQPATAAAVANSIGLSGTDPVATVEAADLEGEAAPQLEDIAARAHVFARVSPAQKLKIVQALQRAGLVVGMTGDGVNDGPALKAANLGIAMGESATEVAKEIAGAVVLDDRAERLADAVREGRAVYRNVQRSIDFLLATNLSEIAVIAGGVGIAGRDIVTPRQLLWLNLISDLWPSLALALEPAGQDLLHRPPRRHTDGIVNRKRAVGLSADAARLAAGSLAAYGFGIVRHGSGVHPAARAGTQAFLALTGGQLLHALNVRGSGDGPSRNRHLDAAVATSLLLQVAAITVPGLRRLLGLTTIDLIDMAAVAAGAVVPFALNGALLDVAIGRHRTVAPHGAIEQAPNGALRHEERLLENAHFKTTGRL
jgi:Ca2+-transporting ATPase